MSNEVATISVQIMDKTYTIKCPQEQAPELQQAARYLDTRMHETHNSGKVIGIDRVAVITALNLCHELLNREGNGSTQIDSVNQRIKQLELKIQETLTQNEQMEL